LTPLGELTEEKQLQSTNQRSILHQVVPFSIADWFPFRLPKWFPFQLPFPSVEERRLTEKNASQSLLVRVWKNGDSDGLN